MKSSLLFRAACIIFFLIVIASCQKEFTIDLFDATASMKDSSGNCLPAAVKGIYKADTILTIENYIDAQINVTSPGDYLIQTNTVNGFSFKGQGVIESTGLQTVRLTATGKPVEPGSFTFEIAYGASTCSINVTVTKGGDGAEYTLKTSSGDCPAVEVKGIYMQAVATDTSNYITFNVHVVKAGSYTLHTETKNGISFESTGNFTDTGLKKIILKAAGTPAAAGDYSISFSGDTSKCSFALTVKPENNDPAVYSINCESVVLSGNYTAGSTMAAANTATIAVTVTTPGKYSITTTTVNGISFSGSGRFTSASTIAKPVVLTATGTALAKGNFTYPVTANSNTCSFPLSFTGPAAFTLAGAPGACAAAVANGTYNKGAALTGANTVIIKANVTATGPYSIATNTVNGMGFSASGSFTATGQQDIVLTGSGTPLAAGAFTFTPQLANACTFDVTVGEVAADAGVFTCKIDGVFTAFNDRSYAANKDIVGLTLALDGFTGPANGENVPELQLYISNNDGSIVKPGTYNVDGYLTGGYRIEIDYAQVLTDGTVIRWNTSSSILSANPPFTIKITSTDATRVKGTFSGEITNLIEGSTKRKKVTEGTLDLPVE